MVNTIRNEMERIQRLYESEWKTITLDTNNVTVELTWKDRFKMFFTGKQSYFFRFEVNVKGEAYIHTPRITYRRLG